MAKEFFVGKTNNTAKKPLKILVGNSSNIAKEVKSIFVGNSSNQAVKVFPSFPDTHQKVEYILNTNKTEFINLGFKPDSYTRSIMKFEIYNAFTSSSVRYLYGVYDGSVGNVYGIGYFNRGSTWPTRLDMRFAGTPASLENVTLNTMYEVDFNRPGGYFYVNDELIGSSVSTFPATQTNAILFGMSNGSNPNGEAVDVAIKLYHFQAYQENTIIRDMYPCYRKADTEVGMYDVVNGVFYVNNGTGIFYKGPDVVN